jgi:transcriptional regulator with XRE-family HTH domain
VKRKSADAVLLDNLRREMEKRHLSHADIAHRSGLSVSTIGRIVGDAADRESLSLERVERIAHALGLAPAELLREGGGGPGAPGPAGTFVKPATFGIVPQRIAPRVTEDLPRQLGRLIEEFFVLPEPERRQLLDTAADMAARHRSRFQNVV